MKKLLISTLTAAALVLTACSSGGETAQATATPAPTQAPAAVSAAGPAPAAQATPEAARGDIYAAYVQEFPEVGTMVRPVETEDGRALILACDLDNELDQLIYDS